MGLGTNKEYAQLIGTSHYKQCAQLTGTLIVDLVTDLDGDIETEIQNTTCLSTTMAICTKEHLSNIWSSIHKKTQHWRWIEKSVYVNMKIYISKNTANFEKIWHIFFD